MADPNRRDVMGGMVRTAGLGGAGLGGSIGLTATVATTGCTTVSDATATTVMRRLADLGAALKTSIPAPEPIRRMFAQGAELAGPVSLGRLIVAHGPPVRALALLPVRQQGVVVDIPVAATFGPAPALALRSIDDGPDNLFDTSALQSSRTAPVDAAPPDLQQAYDKLVAAGGGVLALPPGRLATNLVLHSRLVHISGAGRGATLLAPRDPALPVLRAAYRDGSWRYVTIANLDVTGADGRGIGFAAGGDAFHAGDEYAGRTRFVNVGFSGLDVAIRRAAGQIGLLLDQCGFGAADYHIHSVANPPGRGEVMHAGILTARDCHFTGARLAVSHFDSPVVGTGGVLFDTCVMERNPGFVFHVTAFADVDATTDFVVRDCWNEDNATAQDVSIDGSVKAARYASLTDVGMIRFDGTPLGSLTLRNAVVATYRCPLDNLLSVDSDLNSTLQHHDARGFGSYVPIGPVTGIAAAAQSEPPGRALTFVVPHRARRATVADATACLAASARTPLTFTGSTAVQTLPYPEGIPTGDGRSQRIDLRAGMRVFPAPIVVPPDSWLVWLFSYRLLSGTPPFLQVSGSRGISARRPLAATDWQTLGGIAAVAPGARESSLWLIQDAGAAEFLIGGYNLVAFPDRQRATRFLNSDVLATDA